MTIEWIEWLWGKVVEYVTEPFQSWDYFVQAVSFGVRQFTEFGSKTAWLYLLSSLLIASGIYVWQRRSHSIGADVSLIRFLFPQEVYRHPSAIVDYKFVAINFALKPLVYAWLISGLTLAFYKLTLYVRDVSGLKTLLAATPADPIVAALLTMALADFGFFFAHYLAHRVPLFWIFHQIHHSAEVLTPLTVHRGHPVDECLEAIATSVISAVFAGMYTTATGETLALATLFQVNVFVFAFFLLGFQLRHSHIWVSYGPVLSWIFISPAQHQIHHSRDAKHWNKNFGFTLAVWDALFGTLYVPKERENLRLGVANVNPQDFSSVSKLYFLPFVKAARYLRGEREGVGLSPEIPVRATQ